MVTPAPVRERDAFRSGELVDDRYRLLEPIGSGGSGTVWRAHDQLLRRAVAVKRLVVPTERGAEIAEATWRRAHREGRAAARLHHPRLAAIFDLIAVGGDVCLVMEHVDAPSLAGVLAEHGTLPSPEVARIGAQLAEGLAAAHAGGVLHRDLKPANVLVAPGGAVTLVDFGLSRVEGDPAATDHGLIAGTPHFMAPEVARGAPTTEASDVWSLGATLYAALEGEPPAGDGGNALETLRRVAAGHLRPIRSGGPVADLVARLLDLDPGMRPTAAQAHEALLGPAEADPPALLAPTLTATPEPAAIPGAMPAPAVPVPGPASAPAHPTASNPAEQTAPVPVAAATAAPTPVARRVGALGVARRGRIAVVASAVVGVAGLVGAALGTALAPGDAPAPVPAPPALPLAAAPVAPSAPVPAAPATSTADTATASPSPAAASSPSTRASAATGSSERARATTGDARSGRGADEGPGKDRKGRDKGDKGKGKGKGRG